MAFDGTIPALGNLISNDIPAIQENFSLLEDSQIVDDNLDVASPSNGYYLKLENGLLICWLQEITLSYVNSTFLDFYWDFPVLFISTTYFISFIGQSTSGSDNDLIPKVANVSTSQGRALIANVSSDFVSGDTKNGGIFAIGRWK